MSYQQTLHTLGKTMAKKTVTVLCAALPLLSVVGTAASLSACGFHLRGYETPMRFDAAKTAIVIDDDRTSFPLKLPLTRQLSALGVDVVDSMLLVNNPKNTPTQADINSSSAEPIATITVSNVRFKRYELVGVLTEIRLVLSADVTYQTIQNGKPVTLTNPIQVSRSYQYNEASVSTDDQQGLQIRDWLYDSLARRISDQYVAIGLPKVTPTDTPTSSPLIKTPAATVVVDPES